MASVLDVAKKINKAWNDNVLTDGSVIPECPRLSMGSLGANYPLRGGIPLGQMITFAGLPHSGKTLAAFQAMASYQKEFKDNTCIYIDAEGAFSIQKSFVSNMTGLVIDDPKRFLRYDCYGKSGEEILQDILEIENTADNVGLIIIDSVPALPPQANIDNEFTKDNGMRGSIAKSLYKFCDPMSKIMSRKENSLIFINQVRDGGKTFTGAPIYTEPCGKALEYYSSLKVRFGTRTFTNGDKTDLPASKGEEADGFRLKFTITKTRGGDLTRGGGFLTYRYKTGLDYINDTLEVALKFDFIHRPNAQMYELIDLDTGEMYNVDGNELKFRGKQALFDYLNTHEDFRDQYIKMLERNINNAEAKSLLDETTMKAIMEEEERSVGEDV